MNSKKMQHLLKYQKWYLFGLMILVLTIPLATNLIHDQPLLTGAESYYHLSKAEKTTWHDFHYFPLSYVAKNVNLDLLAVVPLILAIIFFLLFYQLMKQLNTTKEFSFFFFFLLILSPSFLQTFTTISTNSLFAIIILSIFIILLQEKQKIRSLAVLLLALASFFTVLNILILIFLLLIFFSSIKKESYSKLEKNIYLLFSLILLIFNILVTKRSFMEGPFHFQQVLPDLISDLGGFSGISCFTVILAFLGLTVVWKNKKFFCAYLLLLLILPIYFYNTQVIFFLMIAVTFFATISILNLFNRKWALSELKGFAILLILLGVAFSTISYLNRTSDSNPTNEDIEVLIWLKEESLSDSIIFSSPEYGDYIKFFSKREPFYSFEERNKTKKNLSEKIFTSIYISELFPLLKDNNIQYIYLTPKIKSGLSPDQALLFLLKNERFKLILSQKGHEVWEFTEES